MLLPLINRTARGIRVYLASIRITHYDCAIGAAERGPDDVGGGVWHCAVVHDDGSTDGVTEVCGLIGHDVVDGVVLAVGRGVSDGEFVHQDPLVERRDVGYDCHARAREVLVVDDIVYDRPPGAEVGAGLVGELLAVEGIALVGVVGY